MAYYYPKINFGDKKPLFESLMHYYSITENEHSFDFDRILSEGQNSNVSSNINGNDYRIKNIRLADVRGIPGKDENQVPFGINFSEDSIINNAIILANNGTGKSSIFSALEMLFTQEISERKLRRRNPNSIRLEDYSNYLKEKKGVENFSKLISVFLIPKGHKYNDGYDIDELIELIESDMKMIDINAISFFLQRQYITSIGIITAYSIRTMKKTMMKEQNLQKKEAIKLKIQEAETLLQSMVY